MIPFPTFTTPKGEELVVIPRAEYERLAALAAEAAEDADDLRTYLAAKDEFIRSGAEFYPPDLSALLLEHKSRLAAIRHWRGLSLSALALKIGVAESELCDLETKHRQADAATIARLAAALDVRVDWLS